MKEMYKSPVITVEELQKADVLCISAGDIYDTNTLDNVTGAFSALREGGDLTSLL